MNKLLRLLLLINIHFISFSQSWQDVGGGTNNSSHGMLVWNNQLINLGSFNSPYNRVAAWDGTQWSDLGGGVGIVARAGCVWNGNLVVVGDFWNNFQPCAGCNGVAMWDGTQWTAFDQGFNNDVLTCTVYNGDLIIGGDFTEANGVPINRVARWNESTQMFESMGAVTDMDNDVRCMTVFEGELWVGGDFNNIGGQGPLDGLVKWDETNDVWVGGNSGVDLIGGVNETVRVLYVNPNDGNLYMGGEFPELWDGDAAAEDFNMAGVAMYDGSNWYPLGTGLADPSMQVTQAYCRAIHEYNGDLIVGGHFTTADGVACNKIAKWNTTAQTFSPMGQGFDGIGIDEYVKSAAVWNGTFFAGGAYTQAEGGPMNYIAQWYEPTTSAPVAAFSPSATSGCEGTCINFVDNSTNAPTSWNWTFPGASTTSSSAQNPTNICYPANGTYTATLQACNSNGCTTTDIDITIGVAYNLSENIDACQNSVITYPDGTTETITASTSHTSNLTAISGCDSIIVTNVSMVSQYNTSESVTICENETYTYPDGSSEIITVNTSHTSALLSSLGCDSIVVTNVTMALNSNSTETIQTCENSTVTYPDGITETVTTNTSHTSLLSSIWGCDSTVVTNVTVSPLFNTSESISVCGNTSITYPDGTTELVTGNTSYSSLLSSVNGCDS
ncbi:MAG: PKD domain-containing protein, partial [Crocinitomicaceae bacterium]